MALIAGLVVALIVGVFATLTAMERDRAFYPTVLIVTASYYCLFAAMAGAMKVLGYESVLLVLFAALAVLGFRMSLWIVVAAFVAHALFDMTRGGLFSNPGEPAWWPSFCAAFDVMLGFYVAWRIGAIGPSPPRSQNVN